MLLLNSEIPTSLSHLLRLKSVEQESTLRNDEVYIILVRYPRLRPHSLTGGGLSWSRTTLMRLTAAGSTDELINHIIFIYLSSSIYYIKFFIKNNKYFLISTMGQLQGSCPITTFKKRKIIVELVETFEISPCALQVRRSASELHQQFI